MLSQTRTHACSSSTTGAIDKNAPAQNGCCQGTVQRERIRAVQHGLVALRRRTATLRGQEKEKSRNQTMLTKNRVAQTTPASFKFLADAHVWTPAPPTAASEL